MLVWSHLPIPQSLIKRLIVNGHLWVKVRLDFNRTAKHLQEQIAPHGCPNSKELEQLPHVPQP